jgi:phosphoribosylaminoimidazole-succinocarboxamide synthase
MEKTNETVTQSQSQTSAETESRTSILEVIKSGKVRNIYGFNGLVFETSNRLSVFDRVIKEDVPLKGAMLNCISQCNKQLLNSYGLKTDYIPVSNAFYAGLGFNANDVGRLSYGKELTMLPFEFIVRGYLVGSAWKAYKKGEAYCGFTFPDGLAEGSKLPKPIVTPTTKEENGHDRPVTRDECIDLLISWLCENDTVSSGALKNLSARELATEYVDEAYANSLDAFTILSEKCEKSGILFIDTKFEFGLDENNAVVMGDEVGTPDSSRFASAEEYNKSGKIISYDKQIVRDYCSSIGFNGDEDQAIPEVPDEIWEKVTNTYVFIAEELCGKDMVASYK